MAKVFTNVYIRASTNTPQAKADFTTGVSDGESRCISTCQGRFRRWAEGDATEESSAAGLPLPPSLSTYFLLCHRPTHFLKETPQAGELGGKMMDVVWRELCVWKQRMTDRPSQHFRTLPGGLRSAEHSPPERTAPRMAG